MFPAATRTAWAIKNKEIVKAEPTVSRREFVYNIRRASFEAEWGGNYERPGIGARTLAFGFRVIPRFGPLKGLGFKVPTPETEKRFEDSFDAAIKRDSLSFAEANSGDLRISNRDLDTGKQVSPGEYLLLDRTYDKLLLKLAEKKFAGVTPELQNNILSFYAAMRIPDQHGIGEQLTALRAFVAR